MERLKLMLRLARHWETWVVLAVSIIAFIPSWFVVILAIIGIGLTYVAGLIASAGVWLFVKSGASNAFDRWDEKRHQS